MDTGNCSNKSTMVDIRGARRPEGFTALALLATFATFGLACGVAHSQQPKPPQLLTGSASSPVIPPVNDPGTTNPQPGNIVFEEKFGAMSLASTIANVGAWIRGTGCGTFFGTPDCNVQIANTAPVRSGGGNYLHVSATHHGSEVYRTEYGYTGTPYNSPRVNLQPVGGGHYAGQVYWYGYYLCVDKYGYASGTHPRAPSVFANQWHDDDDDPNNVVKHNPIAALTLDEHQLRLYIEHWDEPVGVGNGSGGAPRVFVGQDMYETVWGTASTKVAGNCFPVIWQIKHDTRTRAQGGTGFLRLWLGTNSTPAFEVVDRQVGHAPPEGDVYEKYFQLGGYLSDWRGNGEDGLQWDARYDNFVIMDSTGSWAAMYQSITTP
ncbi:MAG: hypothetical protein ABI640_02225 [Gammaproteobacteria bacterium]